MTPNSNWIKNLFRNRYDEGYSVGWQVGFDLGSSASRIEAKKVTIKALQKAMRDGNIEYNNGLQEAIKIIKETVNA
jgi:20S proteasome alpha/beta subunit